MLVTGGDSGCLVTGDFSGCLATGGETGCLVTGDTGFLVTKVVLLLVWVSSKDWRFCNTGFIYNKKNKLHRPQCHTHRYGSLQYSYLLTVLIKSYKKGYVV